MTERISPWQFHEAGGVEDWRVVFEGACAHFHTGSFTAGVALVDAIGRLADAEGNEACAATWMGRDGACLPRNSQRRAAPPVGDRAGRS